ncbi:MAG: DNA cytosine methyltransferase [Lachnospiraceae bacterium]|nr:DNA cytosine methyltransferase [Lachnospiraceae bacterium]
MQFIDWFAGIGGFRRGMELAGHRCIGFCEYDTHAVASYISMHCITEKQRRDLAELSFKDRQLEILKPQYLNGEWYKRDVREVKGIEVPKASCWGFGAPCTSFSLAGAREGLDGESGLIKEIFRILGEIEEENRPEWIIYENVKGMFSSNRGFDYLAILLAMDELGYDAEWSVFNSKYAGVPQNRERVYTVGHLRQRGKRQIFPFERYSGEDNISVKKLGNCFPAKGQNGNIYDENGLSPTLSAGVGKKGNGIGSSNAPKIALNPTVICGIGEKKSNGGTQYYEQDRIYDATKVAGSLMRDSRMFYALPNNLEYQGDLIEIKVKDKVYYARWYAKEKHYIIVRRLTSKECFRLQGWSDDYYDKAAFVSTETNLYKQAGNGITVNIVKAIAERL